MNNSMVDTLAPKEHPKFTIDENLDRYGAEAGAGIENSQV